MISGILFDFDGVIVQSELIHRKSFLDLFEFYGIRMGIKRWYEEFAGTGSSNIIQRILRENDIEADLEELTKKRKRLYEKRVEKDEVKETTGIREFLRELDEKEMKRAIVSGSYKTNIILTLEKLSLKRYFEIIISGDDMKEKKPSPIPFLTAAKQLELDPKQCIVIEDSIPGAKAAMNANMKLIVVKSPIVEEIEDYELVIENFRASERKKIWDLIENSRK